MIQLSNSLFLIVFIFLLIKEEDEDLNRKRARNPCNEQHVEVERERPIFFQLSPPT